MFDNNYKLDVLYQFNDKYAPYAGVSMYSLFKNNTHFSEITVHIFEDYLGKISEENKKKLNKTAKDFNRKIVFYDTKQLVDIMKKLDMPTYRGSYAANMRLFFVYLIPSSIKKLIYIDSDTIINGKLDELVDIRLENYYQAMVLDSVGQCHKLDLGFDCMDNYYNSGVIVFNVDLWRQDECLEKIIKHLHEKRSHYLAPDQDILNIVMKDRIYKLSLKYNFQPIHAVYRAKMYLKNYGDYNYYTAQEIKEAQKEAVVYHCFRYLGEFPWHKNNLHPFTPLFDTYLKMSEWKEYRKEPAQNGKLLKCEKALYKIFPKRIFLRIFRFSHYIFLKHANYLSLQNKNSKNM